MAGASGLLAGSALFIALEIVFWFGIQFFGGKGGKGYAYYEAMICVTRKQLACG